MRSSWVVPCICYFPCWTGIYYKVPIVYTFRLFTNCWFYFNQKIMRTNWIMSIDIFINNYFGYFCTCDWPYYALMILIVRALARWSFLFIKNNNSFIFQMPVNVSQFRRRSFEGGSRQSSLRYRPNSVSKLRFFPTRLQSSTVSFIIIFWGFTITEKSHKNN